MATGIKDFGIIWLGWFSSWRTTSAWKASAHGLCSFYLEGRQELCQGWAGLGTTPILGWLNSGVCSEMVYSELFRRINLLRATNTLDKPCILDPVPRWHPSKTWLTFSQFYQPCTSRAKSRSQSKSWCASTSMASTARNRDRSTSWQVAVSARGSLELTWSNSFVQR